MFEHVHAVTTDQADIRNRGLLTAAVDRSNALNDAYADAESAVATHPVSTVTDLHAKLAFMIKNDMGDGRDWLEEIADDVARIANVEGR